MYKHLEKRARETPPITLATLKKMKQDKEPISCITAYDASFAALVDTAGVDIVLVGDSLGMVIQGHATTVPVSMEDMVYHSAAVARGLYRPFMIADMPFMSYATREQALTNAARLMQAGGAKMVKLEGGVNQLNVVSALSANDIPVCAHIGLTPQSVHKIGGFRVQGRDTEAAGRMIDDARALQDAGADIVLLECIPSDLGRQITEAIEVPVIGIGAGPATDGQILVLYDILDITQGRTPRFVQNYMKTAGNCADAVAQFVAAVKDGSYPAPEHCFT